MSEPSRDGVLHEGFCVGMIRDDGQWRELNCREDEARARQEPKSRLRIHAIQIACECGWRSPRLVAPWDAYWYPCSVELGGSKLDAYEDVAREMWRKHIEETTQGPQGWPPGYSHA